ncbi:MAG: hypothetical protein OEZ13_02015 [Spirochaetia bacterium]|nr:hypothetical protein [Spirochaetia bacterium]
MTKKISYSKRINKYFKLYLLPVCSLFIGLYSNGDVEAQQKNKNEPLVSEILEEEVNAIQKELGEAIEQYQGLKNQKNKQSKNNDDLIIEMDAGEKIMMREIVIFHEQAIIKSSGSNIKSIKFQYTQSAVLSENTETRVIENESAGKNYADLNMTYETTTGKLISARLKDMKTYVQRNKFLRKYLNQLKKLIRIVQFHTDKEFRLDDVEHEKILTLEQQ